MYSIVRNTAVVAALLLLSSCATRPILDEEPLDQALSLVEKPKWTVGYSQVSVDNQTGEEDSWQIVSIDDERVTALSSNGCEWTVASEWFAGVERWKNCGGSDGVRELLKAEGTLWPLKVGNKSSYNYRMVPENGDVQGERVKCEVVSGGNVTVLQGRMDVFRIECVRTNKWSIETRTWYWSPELGEVKYMRYDNKKGMRRNVDVIRSGL